MGDPERLDAIERELRSLRHSIAYLVRLVEATVTDQNQLDTDVANLVAVVTSLSQAVSDIGTQLTTISSEIAALQAANPGLDLSGLEAAIGNAQALVATATATDVQAQTDAAQGAPPAPTPTPAPPAPPAPPAAAAAPAEDPFAGQPPTS